MPVNENSIIDNTNNEGEIIMNTTCKAVKNDGTTCTNNSKENGYCGIASHIAQATVGGYDTESTPTEVIPTPVNNNKEINMKIWQWLQAPVGTDINEEDVAVRMISSKPSENVAAAFARSVMCNGAPQFIVGSENKDRKTGEALAKTGQNLMAINSGNQEMPLLMHRGVEMGVDFRIASFPVKSLAPERIEGMVNKANFAYANADRAVFISFLGVDDWGLAPLGLNTRNCAKLVKRLNELLRQTSHFYYGEVNIGEFFTPLGSDPKRFDGMSVISRAFATKLGAKETDHRFSIRVNGKDGVIKGDCIVVDEIKGGLDVLFHTDNLKSEFATTGWFLTTLDVHAPLHEVAYDDQTRGNFDFFLGRELVKADLIRFVKEHVSAVEEGGEMYNYLAKMSETPVVGEASALDTLSGTLHAQGVKLTEAGLPAATFSNLTFTTLNAMTRKMNASRVVLKKDGKMAKTENHKKMFLPASNAFVGAVLSWDIYTEMAGQFKAGEDGTRTFFDPRFGLVMPGIRVEKTFDLHGGFDHDDSMCVFAIKVFCSNINRAKELHALGVLDGNLAFGSTADKAVLAGLFIRRPNGPGEYSIEAISPDMPFTKFNMDTIPVVDLANAPLAQSEVFANTEITGVPTSVDYDKEYDREAAIQAILAQTVNPGVGAFANVMMAWAMTFGANSVPQVLIETMEGVVDPLQQTADRVSFVAIDNAVQDMWISFRDKAISSKTPVELRLLATRRIPATIGEGENQVKIGKAIVAAGLATKTEENDLQHLYNLAILRLDKLARGAANATRNNLDTAVAVSHMPFPTMVMQAVREFYSISYGRLAKMDRDFKDQLGDNAHAVAHRHNQVARKAAMENLMVELVEMIEGNPFDTNEFMLALYKHITTVTKKFPDGHQDRVLTQPSPVGATSMLDLFIDACKSVSLI